MELPSNRATEMGLQCSENGENVHRAAVPPEQFYLNAFDLVKVGLSSTFAIAVFIGIGYVVRHVAGPSTIVSILLAAFIAYLVGKIEFQTHFFFLLHFVYRIFYPL